MKVKKREKRKRAQLKKTNQRHHRQRERFAAVVAAARTLTPDEWDKITAWMVEQQGPDTDVTAEELRDRMQLRGYAPNVAMMVELGVIER